MNTASIVGTVKTVVTPILPPVPEGISDSLRAYLLNLSERLADELATVKSVGDTLTSNESADDATVATLSGTTIPGLLGTSKKIRSGTASVTGSLTGIATGLTTAEHAVVTVKAASVVANAATWCTVTYSGGDISIYGWLLTGLAATAATDVEWVAYGT